MRKTLFVMFDFPPKPGGAQRYNWDMVRAFPKDKVVILAPRWENWEEFDAKSGYATYRLPWGWMEKLTIPILMLTAPYIAARHGVEQIWFSKYSRLIYFTTVITSNLLRLPFGLTIFGEDLAWASDDFGIRVPRIAFALRNTVLKKARHIVANSHYSGSLIPAGIAFSVIHPCTDRITAVSNSAHQREAKCVTYLSVGQLTHKKAFDLVIKALALGLPGVPNYRYVICGSGPEKHSLTELIRTLGMGGAVLIISNASEEVKSELYQQADVFVMPSRIEGFGIAFLEAALHGVCSVGSQAGGIPEAVEDAVTGILVQNEDIQGLRNALAILGSDKQLRQQMGEAARIRCERHFLWDRFAAEWCLVFDHQICK